MTPAISVTWSSPTAEASTMTALPSLDFKPSTALRNAAASAPSTLAATSFTPVVPSVTASSARSRLLPLAIFCLSWEISFSMRRVRSSN